MARPTGRLAADEMARGVRCGRIFDGYTEVAQDYLWRPFITAEHPLAEKVGSAGMSAKAVLPMYDFPALRQAHAPCCGTPLAGRLKQLFVPDVPRHLTMEG
ncbi:MAG: hypothetical protein WDM77_10665 [Steroidobacteraceae bacterium]